MRESSKLPANLIDSSNQIASGCGAQTGSTFIAIGRGGILQNPSHKLITNRTWLDIRGLSISRKRNENTDEIIKIISKPAIVEATGFIRHENGEIELVAAQNTPFTSKEVPNCSSLNT